MECPKCKATVPDDSKFCQICGEQLGENLSPMKSLWKALLITVCCLGILLLCVFLIINVCLSFGPMAGGGNYNDYYGEPQLSDSCDYILCSGEDAKGNTYELVANQTESSQGFEITVGVIKNNQWIYPLSNEFPFLGDDGLFHISSKGTSLKSANSIIEKIYFIDSGAFLMDCYKPSTSLFGSDIDYKIIFSCDTLESYTLEEDEGTLSYLRTKAKFSNNQVFSYGEIYTDDGKILLYSCTDRKNSLYKWCVLDVQTLQIDTLATDVKGVYPRDVLSEGLFFATDKCFYNTKMEKVIDLSGYKFDGYSETHYFKNGTCSFTVKNDLGTEFTITIDKTGKVISEVRK